MTARDAREALEELAAERPLVLVLDDLQWAEPPLLDLVEEVAATSRDAPILLVCLARPELLERRAAWGGRSVEASSIVLEPLTGAESERLVDNLLGESDLPDIVRDHIVYTSEGNPLFVEELLATLVDRDVLQRKAGRWTTTEVQAIPVPPSIQALVSARVDRLPEAERAVLELASVEGRSFSSRAVAELSGERDPRETSRRSWRSSFRRSSCGPTRPAWVATSSGTSSSATPPTSRSRSPYGPISTSGSRRILAVDGAGVGHGERARRLPTAAGPKRTEPCSARSDTAPSRRAGSPA